MNSMMSILEVSITTMSGLFSLTPSIVGIGQSMMTVAESVRRYAIFFLRFLGTWFFPLCFATHLTISSCLSPVRPNRLLCHMLSMCAIVSSLLLHTLHLGVILSWSTFALYDAVLTDPSCMAITSPSVSGSSALVVSHLFESTLSVASSSSSYW